MNGEGKDLRLFETIVSKLNEQNDELSTLVYSFNNLYNSIFVPNGVENKCIAESVDKPILSLKDNIVEVLDKNRDYIEVLKSQYNRLARELQLISMFQLLNPNLDISHIYLDLDFFYICTLCKIVLIKIWLLSIMNIGVYNIKMICTLWWTL